MIYDYALPAAASGNSARFSLVRPEAGSMVEGEWNTVVIKLNNGGIDALTVSINGKEIMNAPVSKGKDFFCKTIALSFGTNEIAVSGIEKGRVVESEKRVIFYRSDISREFSVNPPEFQKNPFHQEKKEGGCRPCHIMQAPEKGMKPVRPEDSMCYRCHKKITEYSNVHGPSATWDCLACHDKNSKPMKYITQKPERDLCYICHKEKKEEWRLKKFVHGPAAAGKCSICHNPHASDNPYWLRKPSWDLCINCHEDRASGAHVIVGFGSGTHPTKGKPDPLKYGKELTCASCHNPHASNSKSLFVNDEEDLYNLCQACHKK